MVNGNQKFYVCKHCGNIAVLINDKHVPLVCCGEKMSELIPNTIEANVEKHLPIVTKGIADSSINVQIGSALHPMEKEHHIAFMYVESEKGGQRKHLKAGEEPKLEFCFSNDKPITVYAYCNLHGLWKTEIK
jgi:superoxide reductase